MDARLKSKTPLCRMQADVMAGLIDYQHPDHTMEEDGFGEQQTSFLILGGLFPMHLETLESIMERG